MRQSPARPAHRAFTLVELMVVIGIIAVLVGILVPSFIYVRQRAMVAGCLNRLKAVADGITNYGASRMYLPNSYKDGAAPWYTVSPLGPLYTSKALVCPGDSSLPNVMCGSDAGGSIPADAAQFQSSYAMNYWVDHNTPKAFSRKNGHPKEGNTILIGESDWACYRNDDDLGPLAQAAIFPTGRHSSTLNFLMFDLSVRSVTAAPVSADCAAPGLEGGDWGAHLCLFDAVGIAWTDALSQ
ncbi:MAG: prepilin-type N-terminal cleavage/methylation domain-containing protein [Planctomycetaceae bacterium]|nr:prepilin-type N-terminal cleavage/methylation domain-containing protein [Planctomycetaceae bacterium]